MIPNLRFDRARGGQLTICQSWICNNFPNLTRTLRGSCKISILYKNSGGLTAQNLVRRPHHRPRFVTGSSPCEDKHCGEGTCCVTHLLDEIFLSELHNILSAELSRLHPKNAKSKDERAGQGVPLQHLVRRWMVLPESLPTATGDVLSVVKSDVVCF